MGDGRELTGPVDLDPESWGAWRHHILKEIKRLAERQEAFNTTQTKIHIELAMLKVKSGIWGLIGGAIPVIIGLIFFVLKIWTKAE